MQSCYPSEIADPECTYILSEKNWAFSRTYPASFVLRPQQFGQHIEMGRTTSKPFVCHEAACGEVKKIALLGILYLGLKRVKRLGRERKHPARTEGPKGELMPCRKNLIREHHLMQKPVHSSTGIALHLCQRGGCGKTYQLKIVTLTHSCGFRL